ncbi:MAG TPA: hypothetical protein VJ085_10775 [Candidatus Acidoferrales bacterium]|nr:hypothetical protein [Candidatus Acidoferrales bacterium]
MIFGPSFYKIAAKTTDYRMVPGDLGTLFTTRGATTPTLYLPITGDVPAGWWCMVYSAADSNVVVAVHNTLDNMTTFNDLTADSVAYSTATEIIGGGWMFVWDGTGWLTFIFAEETQTMTVA